jgi:cytidylate kinase
VTSSLLPPAPLDVVALDGPGGVGKSSVAREVASRLGWLYIDTGAMYRTVTLAALERELSLTDESGLAQIAREAKIELKPEAGGEPSIWLNGRDVTNLIRTNEISTATALVADTPTVRHLLVTHQRRLGEQGRVVMDGRDITTVVFPQARWKFYLDASLDERVQRRAEQLMARGLWVDSQELSKQIMERDRRDRIRPVGPLRIANDATVIDTTSLTFNTVVETLLAQVTAGLQANSPVPTAV